MRGSCDYISLVQFGRLYRLMDRVQGNVVSLIQGKEPSQVC